MNYILTETDKELIRELVDLGYGRCRIQEKLNRVGIAVKKDAISKVIKQIKSRADTPKAEQVESLLRLGASAVEVARATGSTIGIAQSWIDKVKGDSCTVERQLREELSRGTTLNKLKVKFGIESSEELERVVADTFDNVMLHIAPKPGTDDFSVVLIPDSSGQFNWLNSNKNERPFSYFINTDQNYMFVKVDENLIKGNELKIFNFTDLHIGSKNCRTELLKNHIKMVRDDDQALCVFGGDLFDYMHKMSLGQPWEQSIAPMEQVAVSARMLMPLAHKTVLYVSGNHDRGRGYKYVGADLAGVLADFLKVPYSYKEVTVDIEFGGNIFTLMLDHGHGSGSTLQAITNKAEAYIKNSSYFVHWHMSGHVHNAQVVVGERLTKEIGKGLVSKRFYTVIGGSYMSRTGSYAEEAKYRPTPQDLSYIILRKDGTYGASTVAIDAD